MSEKLRAIHTHALDFWLARASVLLVIGFQWMIINKLTVGPRWLAPGIEFALLLPLSLATAWTQSQARDAVTERHWVRVATLRLLVRNLAVVLTAVVSVLNFGSLLLLVRALLTGHVGTSGQTLLLDALNIWATNVIAFALWYWSIDRGGPASRGVSRDEVDDFLFPQMTIDTDKQTWSPGFVDYLYLSFTNATAFSPTDTLPLTPRVKLLMMAESAISLLTLALVAARAVNILA